MDESAHRSATIVQLIVLSAVSLYRMSQLEGDKKHKIRTVPALSPLKNTNTF